MTEHEHDDLPPAPESSLFDDPVEHPPEDRPDPRLRPPDPAGTQPKYDPDDLLPSKPDRLNARHSVGAAAATAGAATATAQGALSAPERPGPQATPADADAGSGADGQAPSESRYAPRFQFLLGALLAVGAAAIVFAVALLVHNDRTTPATTAVTGPAWSTWQPTANGQDGPTQISDHVGHEYRLPDGKQMVAVTGGPLEIAGLPVTVAVRATGGDIKLFNGTGVLYRMCGLGTKCAIAEGKASTKRHLLLRREALELALYSFRYLSVDEAVVFLPPRKGQDPSQALFFRRSDTDLRNAVARPLDATLVGRTPSVSGVTSSPDAQLVNTITTSKLFSFSFTQANQDARAFLVLDPLGR